MAARKGRRSWEGSVDSIPSKSIFHSSGRRTSNTRSYYSTESSEKKARNEEICGADDSAPRCAVADSIDACAPSLALLFPTPLLQLTTATTAPIPSLPPRLRPTSPPAVPAPSPHPLQFLCIPPHRALPTRPGPPARALVPIPAVAATHLARRVSAGPSPPHSPYRSTSSLCASRRPPSHLSDLQ